MTSFIVRRIASAVPTLLVIMTLTFFLLRTAPGGPFTAERALEPEIEKLVRAHYHLDEPLLKQYGLYMWGLLRLDLGPSLKHRGSSVNELLWEAFPKSLSIGACALIFAVGVGVGAGVISAVRQNTPTDYLTMSVAMVGVCVPSMVLGPVLMHLFAVKLRWFPVYGWGSWRHLVLPSMTLGAMFAARIARLTRGSMLETIRKPYIVTARAKGLRESVVVIRHALRSALLPLVSYLGPAAASIVTGSVVIEQIFNVPGMGGYFVSAPNDRDYTLVLGTVLFYSTLLIAFNVAVDILYAYLDPRVKLE